MCIRRVSLILIVAVLTMGAAVAHAQPATLGTVDFPTSGSPQAQTHFLRGVAALHSFWYPVALEEFRAATKVEPDFMMGYWGEAMAHNHPIWGDPQNTDAARQVLKNIKDTSTVTPRERAYLRAVQILYGEGDKSARDKAYAAAMENIYRDDPDDLEAAAFYALALLGTVRTNARHDPASTRTRMKAAAIAQEVIRKEPNHPGAVHYLIHAFDDPDHAILALPAAQRYAEIAPKAPHALHMPSHIFLQLGRWSEAAASNEASWMASDQWVQRQGLPVSERDYHSLHWLLYVYLQQGRYREAEAQLALMDKSLAEFPEDAARSLMYGAYTRASMAAAFVVETERWDAAGQLLRASLEQMKESKTSPGSNPYQGFAFLARVPAVFASGLAATKNDSPDAEKCMAELRAMHEQLTGKQIPFAAVADLIPVLEIQELEIAAALNAAKGDFDEAVKTMEKATALEEATPSPSGPPLLIKPSHELFGEILLGANRPKESAEQFAKSLFRHPGRARSLLGAARVAARSGDTQVATKFYAQFAEQWRQAEGQSAEWREAQNYLKNKEGD